MCHESLKVENETTKVNKVTQIKWLSVKLTARLSIVTCFLLSFITVLSRSGLGRRLVRTTNLSIWHVRYIINGNPDETPKVEGRRPYWMRIGQATKAGKILAGKHLVPRALSSTIFYDLDGSNSCLYVNHYIYDFHGSNSCVCRSLSYLTVILFCFVSYRIPLKALISICWWNPSGFHTTLWYKLVKSEIPNCLHLFRTPMALN